MGICTSHVDLAEISSDIWRALDVDEKGHVTASEIRLWIAYEDYWRNKNITDPAAQAQKILDIIDSDGSGTIEENEMMDCNLLHKAFHLLSLLFVICLCFSLYPEKSAFFPGIGCVSLTRDQEAGCQRVTGNDTNAAHKLSKT